MDQRQKRFVVLRHEVGPQLERTDQTHLDWMFEVGGVLRTWATEVIANFDQPMDVGCELLSDHRIAYLDYDGEIPGDRGRVTRLLGGTYRSREAGGDEFIADLSWHHDSRSSVDAEAEVVAGGTAVVTCYRSFLADSDLRRDVSRGGWRLRFSPGR